MNLLWILKRILSVIPTLALLTVLTFFLLRLAPGGPFDSEHAFPPEIQNNILKHYHLDESLPQQFLRWLGDLGAGNLGESFVYLEKPVAEIIQGALPVSLLLGILALLLAISIGIPFGAIAAFHPEKKTDTLVSLVAIAGVSLPPFLTATVLILIFSLGLGWLPPALWEGPSSLILPTLALALRPLSIVIRMTRISVKDTYHQDYIRTARGKGVSEQQILFKHALRNSLIPVLTTLGPLTANLLTGSFVIEVIFQIPGMGKHFVQAVLNRDYPLVMGVTLVYGAILILSNLLADLLISWADPRVELST